ncbi:hypothetical protein COS81_02515 [candidate division WWE3 bacterium CG06_land_8_20_14_3_00_42_16]|uniref:Transcriptional regulator n=4 Tax=Katanobacteria TaxID=422282 RepID=A0A2M7AN67_UNCKA|nr:MAG: hypothetical protein COS81_02515 [candidate division WWE3 bacterium CG06_land_8_20_14_3_00_42_16]PIZ42398.1 MAG: hypothetical protein COY34_02940 [candidate division WWE3 bacterium CG_4_10_14_0_2_um_filter_42_8]PJA37561.1 MAG: hypothetical protein CO181_02945 [candidate division WWE3 bacterium CG_4_9_14_3_um_filter_43_9]PJC69097.1 MAG: hypothetical protein CO015_01500 [candidate division WWE3 bacterium CG_4_8_14_3_um_filter_42_11]
MSTRKNFFLQFNEMPFFTSETINAVAERFEIPRNTVISYIQRSIKDKSLMRLKRGIFATAAYFEKQRSNVEYAYAIGCKLLEPSYISRESALQHYGILSEAVNTVITLITTQTTRRFTNRLGIMDYKNMNPNLFGGFEVVQKDFTYLIARPAKAIFDYLYYRIPRADLRSKDKVLHSLDEFRLDYEGLGQKELDSLFELLKKV